MDFWNVLPHGQGFGHFSLPHLAWLGIFAAASSALCLTYRRCGERARRGLSLGLAAALLLAEAARILVLHLRGQMSLGFLPLHYCGLSVFIEAWFLLRGGKYLGDVLYATCMPGALMALLFPEWVDYPAFSFLSQNSFVIHTLLTAIPLMLVCGGRIRPDAKNLPRCFLFLLLLAAPVYVLDRLSGLNFMFLLYPAPGSPLMWFGALGSPGYLLGFLPLIAAAWTALYLPWLLIDRRKNKKL